MLFVSWRVRAQLARMAATGLITADMLEAIEDDGADALRDLITGAIDG
jgi:hypothetical protein